MAKPLYPVVPGVDPVLLGIRQVVALDVSEKVVVYLPVDWPVRVQFSGSRHRLGICGPNAVRVVRGGDEDSLSDLGSPSPFWAELVWREDGRCVCDAIPLLLQRLDDDLPLVGVARSGEVPNVLEEKHRGVTFLDDLEDVEVERAPHLVQHPGLGAGLGERLAREPSGEDVVGLDSVGHAVFACINCDVTEGADAPVLLVDAGGVLVDFDRVGALAAHPRQGRVETPDTREQVNVVEGDGRHGISLAG